MPEIAVSILGITGLLALTSLLPPFANRLNLPLSVMLAGVGCALGAIVSVGRLIPDGGLLGDFLAALRSFEISPEALLYVFLPTLLFETALAIDVRRLLDDLAPILLMAVVAVIVCMLVVGLALDAIADVGLVTCLLLGAIVATTDPVAVVGVFRDLGAPRRLSILVEGESLFNDAAAIALFSLLMAMLTDPSKADPLGTTLALFKGFLGGALVGFLAARGAFALFGLLHGLRLAEITLTVVLAYFVYVIAERYFHVSGVVAVVVAGLVTGWQGRIRVTPSTWDSLIGTWAQLGFWASSLIFLFAAMLVPRLLADLAWSDGLLLVVLFLATLAARAIVLYGLLPLLSLTGMADRVSDAFKLVILWGGLRGAVSLALALAVSENDALPGSVRHFVAVLTTGYVLATLLINGTTLRPLLRLLRLDQLSPVDRAVRDRALMLSLGAIREQIEEIAAADRIERSAMARVCESFSDRIATVRVETASTDILSEAELLQIGLITLATREQELYLERFKERVVSRKSVQILIARVGWMRDGAKTAGREGYDAAVRRAMGFTLSFRLALRLHYYTGISYWLAQELADRFERLLIIRMGLQQLLSFNDRQLTPMLGAAVGEQLTIVLGGRITAIEQALAALRLQFPTFARTLESRYLDRVAARLEGSEYDEMLRDSIISREVYNDLDRRLGTRWQQLDRRPTLDMELRREQLIGRVPLFAELEEQRLRDIAGLLRPRLALPGERIITKGRRGDAMYFIASGAVEVQLSPAPVRLGTGDFIGEIALVTHQPRTADVVALGYCHLLVLRERDFERLLTANEALRARISDVARQRLGVAPAAL
ncbi:MAG TPA: cation:proton antiporter [Methylomirabilota bacterium]|nr:cation:proton antiporter [Methylomirabilota bacterium]